MDRGAWRATVHGVAGSWTVLSDLAYIMHGKNLTKEHGYINKNRRKLFVGEREEKQAPAPLSALRVWDIKTNEQKIPISSV